MYTLSVRKTVLFGLGLWFVGYVLGFILYPFVSQANIGWYITPIGIVLTVWVLRRYFVPYTLTDALLISGAWTLIAIVLDYIGIVMLLHPADGYYKLDVYLYYIVTAVLPLVMYMASDRNIEQK